MKRGISRVLHLKLLFENNILSTNKSSLNIVVSYCCNWLLQPRSFYSVNSGGLVRISTIWLIKMCPCILWVLWICFYSLNGIKEQKTLSQYSCVHSIKILDPLYLKFNGKQKVGLTISVTLHISPSYRPIANMATISPKPVSYTHLTLPTSDLV